MASSTELLAGPHTATAIVSVMTDLLHKVWEELQSNKVTLNILLKNVR